eukprot:1088421-Amphidinium_carterae.1
MVGLVPCKELEALSSGQERLEQLVQSVSQSCGMNMVPPLPRTTKEIKITKGILKLKTTRNEVRISVHSVSFCLPRRALSMSYLSDS